MGIKTLIITGLCVCAAATGATAESGVSRLKAFAATEEQPLTVELILQHTSVQPGGRTQIGVLFNMEPGWHIYAQKPGDAGLPTKVAWNVPKDVSIGPLHWPKPEEFVDPGNIHTFGYSATLVLSAAFFLAPTVNADQTLPVSAEVEWLACKEICLPGSTKLEITVPVNASAPVFSMHTQFFDHTAD